MENQEFIINQELLNSTLAVLIERKTKLEKKWKEIAQLIERISKEIKVSEQTVKDKK